MTYKLLKPIKSLIKHLELEAVKFSYYCLGDFFESFLVACISSKSFSIASSIELIIKYRVLTTLAVLSLHPEILSLLAVLSYSGNAFLTSKIQETDDFKEFEMVFMKFAKEVTKNNDKAKQIVKKDDDDSVDMIEPGSHKENPEFVNDGDDKEEEKQNDDIEDNAPHEREKRVKRSKKSKRSKSAREDNVIDEDVVIPKDETPELIAEFHNIDKHVSTIFDHARIEAKLRDTLSNQYRNDEEYAYHLEQSTNFMEN
ncbi:hypothetical protein Tco_0033928 [Tanacetum coccineum]